MNEVEWLLDCEPREVQLEGLRRSYYGFRYRDNKDDKGEYRPFRKGPAREWGHLLEMRLGKTPLALNEMMLLHRDEDVRTFMVFAPNTYKYDWAAEAEKYGVTVDIEFIPFELSKVDHAAEKINQARKEKRAFCLIVNYEAIQHEHGEHYLTTVINTATDGKSAIFADESIKLKGHDSLRTQAARKIREKAMFIRILTGKPMTQGPQDIYGQWKFMRLLDGKNFFAFRNRFCKMGGFKGKKIVGVREERLEELQNLITRNAFVAKRMDWGNVADTDYVIDELHMTPEQKKAFEELENDFLTQLDNGEIVSVDQVITKIMKQQQVSSGFLFDEEGRVQELVAPKKVPKFQRILNMIEDEIEGKTVICYHYSPTGDRLLEALKAHDPCVIRGDMWMKQAGRDLIEEKKKFNTGNKHNIIIVQIEAGKYGHDLTGNPENRAATMLFAENTFSLDSRDQIEARITTAFQYWPSLYIDFVTNKVEKRPIQALIQKEDVVETVMGSYGKKRWSVVPTVRKQNLKRRDIK